MRKKRNREVDEVDDFYETLLRSGPFPGDDEDELRVNRVLARMKELDDGTATGQYEASMLEDELRTAVIIMVHGGRDPSMVPYRHIRHALENPITIGRYGMEYDASKPGTRSGVTGPLRAIRVKCTMCMGGDVNAVRECAAVNCFLHSFRMGTNPFYGRLVNADAEAEAVDTDSELAELQAEHEREEADRMDQITKGKHRGS